MFGRGSSSGRGDVRSRNHIGLVYLHDNNIVSFTLQKLSRTELQYLLLLHRYYTAISGVNISPGIHVFRTKRSSFAAVSVASRYEVGRDADALDFAHALM